MRKIECPNCASASFNDIGWNKYICQYCGTVVETDDDVIMVARFDVPVNTYRANIVVEEEIIKLYPNYAERIPEELAKKFLPYVIENMEIEEECDSRRMQRVYRATFRIVGR